VKKACTKCKAAKTKCDDQRPCSRCVRRGHSDACVDPEDGESCTPKLHGKRPSTEISVSSYSKSGNSYVDFASYYTDNGGSTPQSPVVPRNPQRHHSHPHSHAHPHHPHRHGSHGQQVHGSSSGSGTPTQFSVPLHVQQQHEQLMEKQRQYQMEHISTDQYMKLIVNVIHSQLTQWKRKLDQETTDSGRTHNGRRTFRWLSACVVQIFGDSMKKKSGSSNSSSSPHSPHPSLPSSSSTPCRSNEGGESFHDDPSMSEELKRYSLNPSNFVTQEGMHGMGLSQEKNIFQLMPCGIITIQLQPCIGYGVTPVWCNGAMSELLGYPQDVLISRLNSKSFTHLYSLSNISKNLPLLLSAFESHSPSVSFASVWNTGGPSSSSITTLDTYWIKYDPSTNLPVSLAIFYQDSTPILNPQPTPSPSPSTAMEITSSAHIPVLKSIRRGQAVPASINTGRSGYESPQDCPSPYKRHQREATFSSSSPLTDELTGNMRSLSHTSPLPPTTNPVVIATSSSSSSSHPMFSTSLSPPFPPHSSTSTAQGPPAALNVSSGEGNNSSHFFGLTSYKTVPSPVANTSGQRRGVSSNIYQQSSHSLGFKRNEMSIGTQHLPSPSPSPSPHEVFEKEATGFLFDNHHHHHNNTISNSNSNGNGSGSGNMISDSHRECGEDDFLTLGSKTNLTSQFNMNLDMEKWGSATDSPQDW